MRILSRCPMLALCAGLALAPTGALAGRAVETLIFLQPGEATTLDDRQRARLIETLDKVRATWCQADIVTLGYVAGPDHPSGAPLPKIAVQRLATVYTLLRRQGVHDSLIQVERSVSGAAIASVWIEMVGHEDPACRGAGEVFQDALPALGEPYRPWR